jgi:hypothetical protein
MGNFQIRGIGQDEIAEKEDVNIQGAFPPAALLFPIPAKLGFDPVDKIQQFPGLPRIPPPQGGIEEPVLIRNMERGGFKKRSDPYFPQEFPQNPQGIGQDPGGIPLI